jgi:hypothetical protein
VSLGRTIYLAASVELEAVLQIRELALQFLHLILCLFMQSLIHCLSLLNFVHLTFFFFYFVPATFTANKELPLYWKLLLITERFQKCIFHLCILKFIFGCLCFFVGL